MARSGTSITESETPVPEEREVESLLAFQLDERGIPRFIAEFNSEADKLALLYFGQAVIAELGRSAVESVLARSRATPMCPKKHFENQL
jgi:hypothetical protein